MKNIKNVMRGIEVIARNFSDFMDGYEDEFIEVVTDDEIVNSLIKDSFYECLEVIYERDGELDRYLRIEYVDGSVEEFKEWDAFEDWSEELETIWSEAEKINRIYALKKELRSINSDIVDPLIVKNNNLKKMIDYKNKYNELKAALA